VEVIKAYKAIVRLTISCCVTDICDQVALRSCPKFRNFMFWVPIFWDGLQIFDPVYKIWMTNWHDEKVRQWPATRPLRFSDKIGKKHQHRLLGQPQLLIQMYRII